MNPNLLENLENIDIEIPLFLEAIFQKYGYDFRDYSTAHIKRRLMHRMAIGRFETISQMQDKILRDKSFFISLLEDLSINVTEMFRDPEFYSSFREHVVPNLRTYPFIKIWHAGCATGEEVYSLAILLKEENLLDRCQIYATDFNRRVLDIAKLGIYPTQDLGKFSRNYLEAGGKGKLSDYYTLKYGSLKLDQSLSKKVVFADHNLVTDNVFAEVNLILCRNVLIYFNKDLQNKVIDLFYKSLSSSGFLCLGTKESLRFTQLESNFANIDSSQKIYKKRIN
ncbi:protein-glutamate O-methyltransferase CheR [Labilibaculum sp. A4]|uniref:Protein-glutamate O-methyltransferase CheR n=1 Tax=Labilibaculum euxinus TaxID=2686357 RepID=A0A425YE23_9BACT|nr:protein-glutamate O-methyltransferase CheR [Labilibaculum euxinus]MDQ1770898.1 protein-glutamate O-methyltransferase CheR [Labilibaculum euxinus]MUP37472.1 protein-glutamate O-methyltransferase CheR [Labilibaculum euxinus]MVB06677.1 protein-glutamate O-methyltransferase CheR [Labilibaculum euxinus]MWN76068.1 protein-glutamate O-methyltransferase CheR [Labilibaculum euxinus]